VYRGSLACGEPVAIKLSKASAEASKDFLREVDIITKLKHPRIVPLIGVCVEGPHLISVYRYLPRGSLEDNLHGIPARFSSSTPSVHFLFFSGQIS
jgi:serine/threonine protein kinase